MARQKLISAERQKLEACIGDATLITPPPKPLKGRWNKAVQADAILSLVESSLREASAVFLSTTDEVAALKLNRSSLGHELQKPAHQRTLAAAAKILAHEAGIDPKDVRVHKPHNPLSKIFGSPILVVLASEESAQQLLNHVRTSNLKQAELA